jgi:hypothetical protein
MASKIETPKADPYDDLYESYQKLLQMDLARTSVANKISEVRH